MAKQVATSVEATEQSTSHAAETWKKEFKIKLDRHADFMTEWYKDPFTKVNECVRAFVELLKTGEVEEIAFDEDISRWSAVPTTA